MDWQKVITTMKAGAKFQADEADRHRNGTNAKARQYSMGTGAASVVLNEIANALEAGLARQAYTMSKAVDGDVKMPAGTIVYEVDGASNMTIEGTLMYEVTLNANGSRPSFYVEAPTLYAYTPPKGKTDAH